MTKNYTFEYTKGADLYRLFGISVLILITELLVLPTLLGKQYLLITTIAIIAIPVIFFLVRMKRLKKTGTATLTDNDIELDLNSSYNIPFKDLRYYYKHDGKNELSLTLGLLNKEKITVMANNNFSNADGLNELITDFEATIEKFKLDTNANIIHLESDFARKNSIYVLIAFTILTIGGFIFTTMPLMIIPIALTMPLLGGWLRYFMLKKNNQLTGI